MRPALANRSRLLVVGAVVVLLSALAVLLRDSPAADRALDVARDPGRFSSASEARTSLSDIGDSAKQAFSDCGAAPACHGWAQAAAYARTAAAMAPRCTAAGLERVRLLVLSYLEAVSSTPSERTAPDPAALPNCR